MPRRSTRLAPRQPVARSRVTNGTDVLPGIDQRSTVARRYRDICAAIASDQGGAEHLSEARHQLIRRFAAAAVLAEQIEARMAMGETIDIGQSRLAVFDDDAHRAEHRHRPPRSRHRARP